jgi:hypothetical protein
MVGAWLARSKPFHDCGKPRLVPYRSSGEKQPTALSLRGHVDALQLQTLLP